MPRHLERLIRGSSVIVASWLFTTAFVLAGCNGPATTGSTGAGPTACLPGEVLQGDGTCQPTGLPDMPCAPGEQLLKDGVTCQKVGVPDSACGVGFTPDGKQGCEPILPANPCPEGQMAIPGDTACHEVAPCGSGTWGDIPIEANTQFVDQAYMGGNSDGTQAKPWVTIQEGVNKAANGAIVAVAAGLYAEDVVILSKPVRIWGRCPAMVEVAGTGGEVQAIGVFNKTANGAEIHGVAVTGAMLGIRVSGASDVTMESVWIHGTGSHGLEIGGANGPAGVALKGSLVEQNDEVGVLVVGSNATIEASVVRSTLPNAQGKFGRGIAIQDDPAAMKRANGTVRTSVIEQNHEVGVIVIGSDATIEATVVRSTQPGPQGTGHGIEIGGDPLTKERANGTVRACIIEQNQGVGLFVVGSDATIEATVVRSNLPDEQGQLGHGIHVQDDAILEERANVTVRACLVEQNHEVGVFVGGSDAAIEATVVRDTAARSSDNTFGDGIAVFGSNAAMQYVEVTHNARAGVSNLGSQVVITGGVFTCNGVDLEGQPYNDIHFSFDGSAGWQCSAQPPAECTELGDCHVETPSSESPSELPPVEPLPE